MDELEYVFALSRESLDDQTVDGSSIRIRLSTQPWIYDSGFSIARWKSKSMSSGTSTLFTKSRKDALALALASVSCSPPALPDTKKLSVFLYRSVASDRRERLYREHNIIFVLPILGLIGLVPSLKVSDNIRDRLSSSKLTAEAETLSRGH